VSEAPPSREALTISATCFECELVNTLVNSGIRAPASVPHEMITESFHHIPSAIFESMASETMNVTMIDTIEVSHTRTVKGASKLNFFLPL
jgi:hypothetical protein